ncbi:SIR2 family NAD-dependent protein deacylase [Raoultibacter massiliensis]|uniref:SIR2 family NAD-dependent protein deacylase n=1 Tax=Raoultibacter massiliensis TaxID=1852371 RepID=UPI003A955A79
MRENTYSERIRDAARALASAEKVIIGGGSGLSTAAGLDYGGERFQRLFGAWAVRYGIADMYAGAFFPYPTDEERWAYWAHHVLANRFDEPPLPLYASLLDLVRNHDFTVITTNVESQFEKSGFPAERIFEVQGNYGFIQCARGCHDRLYPDERLMRNMDESAHDLKVPAKLVPACPVCGGPMEVHVRMNAFFVENEAWHAASAQYDEFVRSRRGRKTVLLELGVGFNTPGIIRYPFETMTLRDPKNTTLIRLNKHHPEGIRKSTGETIAFDEDVAQVIEDLLERKERI